MRGDIPARALSARGMVYGKGSRLPPAASASGNARQERAHPSLVLSRKAYPRETTSINLKFYLAFTQTEAMVLDRPIELDWIGKWANQSLRSCSLRLPLSLLVVRRPLLVGGTALITRW